MDWALDHSPLSLCDVDLRKVFRYEPGSATVIRLNASSTEPRVWVLNDEQWKEWILDNPPAGEYAEANMTLV
ncbi:hypothetical protein CGCF415_v011741 [Colletotrichum fructicola]|uniref:Uncharacterized protein n=1 Tax=Colletotrichum fructicola (strain Nara gc5) TaxID=1213859 RepID=A0A7J6IQ68_COLFN|nr:hypothetical protein CFRS1_v001201 [Colletotrichum fructicola]KAF4479055.1 hypothetical protein CGGC5_v012644 [Colletotrichum fructicola Nara gc5]KAF4896017.1 hypothetical protein CGCF415_v011741 [Colletotrichum fructicola]KAF4900866.1 hypothetical protein CGCFRS4_v003083 [Colletotrichum fructicola]KAF4930258.1 hypothetical protein CGCF245_v011766 [Colletotrichum fructicola]